MTNSEIWRNAVRTWDLAAEELRRLSSTVDPEAFAVCTRAIAGCAGRIAVSGSGTSGAAARKIAHSLSCIERPSFFLCPTDAVHGALGSVQPGDIAVLISKGGNTPEIVNLLPAFKAKGVTVLAVTENPESKLAGSADLRMIVKVGREADPFNMLATTSTMAVVAVFDALCVAVMEFTGYTREQFAVIHPSGAVGERLKKEGRPR